MINVGEYLDIRHSRFQVILSFARRLNGFGLWNYMQSIQQRRMLKHDNYSIFFFLKFARTAQNLHRPGVQAHRI